MGKNVVEFCLRVGSVCPLVEPAISYTVTNVLIISLSAFALVHSIHLVILRREEFKSRCINSTTLLICPRAVCKSVLLWMPAQLCFATSERVIVYGYKLHMDIPVFGGRRWIALIQCVDVALFLGIVVTNYIKRLLRVVYQSGQLSEAGLYHRSLIWQALFTNIGCLLVAGFSYGRVNMNQASYIFVVGMMASLIRDGVLFLIVGLKLPAASESQTSQDTTAAIQRLRSMCLITPTYIMAIMILAIVILSSDKLRSEYSHSFFLATMFGVTFFTVDATMYDHRRITVRNKMRIKVTNTIDSASGRTGPASPTSAKSHKSSVQGIKNSFLSMAKSPRSTNRLVYATHSGDDQSTVLV